MEVANIKFRLTSRSKIALQQWMRSSSVKNPVPGLTWSQNPESRAYDWVVGLHERDKIPDNFPGHWIERGGLAFFVPQGDYAIGMLKGKVLDRINERYVIMEDKQE